jgi:hypothetical protein
MMDIKGERWIERSNNHSVKRNCPQNEPDAVSIREMETSGGGATTEVCMIHVIGI